MTTLPPAIARRHGSAGARRTGARALPLLLWRRRSVVAFVLVLVAGTVGLGLALAERHYTATARVAVTPPPGLPQTAADHSDLVGTMADVAVSRPILDAVAEQIGVGSEEDLRDRVRSEVVAGTVILQVSATDRDPAVAARVANAVAEALPAHDPTDGAAVFHTTEPADPPDEPSSPDDRVVLLAGAAVAVMAAIASAALADRLVRTVDGGADVVEATDIPVLGALPRPASAGGLPAPGSAEPGPLRALRVAIEFAGSQQPTRLLVVASADGADPWGGWLEVNLAVALAEVGHRVLLVDAVPGDASRAPLHPALDVPGGAGLSEVLAGDVTIADAVRPGPAPGVHLLPPGGRDVAALLELRFRQLLVDTADSHDVVLVRAAPVTGSEDARIMAVHGAALLLVPAGQVHPRTLQRAVAHLAAIRVRVLGCVVVGVRGRR